MLVMFREFFSRQARKPSGLFGRLLAARIFDKGNAALNRHMISLVDASGSDRILEIGFGTGQALDRMAASLTDGVAEGIDFSEAMLKVAGQRNRHHISVGRVKLTLGDFGGAAYGQESFDTVCSTNTIYFWSEPEATMGAIFDVLKPGGVLVLGFVAKERMDTMPLSTDVFRSYSPDEVLALAEGAGFTRADVHGHAHGEYCIKAFK
ncbi:class I SAM-dependent methyltransferase [uncultured Pseudodesulfovibrio sp.]|uniref:class I SAM-dependent methyltransferase n=1 Tax=uncultured Pseudodesulfovibrio sp. TaxID=2035858 RepID=UPI0029C76690|nr:class I SAM-dependent methyltransferase [uncultured Pseudodesulfovibrio sp.]